MARNTKRQRQMRRQAAQEMAQQPACVKPMLPSVPSSQLRGILAPPPLVTTFDPAREGGDRTGVAIVREGDLMPRRFRKTREFVVGPFTVTVSGEDDALENEFYPVLEGDELHLYFNDAAIDRRAAKQSGVLPPGVQVVVPARPSVQTYAQQPETAGAVHVPGLAYDGIGPAPAAHRKAAAARSYDPQAEALAEVGTSPEALAASMGLGTLLGPDEEVQ